MPFELIVVSDNENGLRCSLADGATCDIGRGSDADFQLSDPRISRVHCRLDWDDEGRPMLVDLGSTGGTVLNGGRIKESAIRNGDRIEIGESVLVFRRESGDPTTIVSSPRAESAPAESAVKDLKHLIGSRIHDFQIEAIVSEGKAGMVFRANDVKQDRGAALKVLWPDLSRNAEAAQRFVRGMKTMFPIRHPNIVRLYSAGTYKNLCWVAMEFVDGEDLTKVIERIGLAGMIDWKFGFRVAVQIGRALATAFQHNIVHRNITPRNILYDETTETCKLGDLMLAKALEQNPAEQITRPGQLIGELAYLGPERTGGDRAVDCRSDIYGLGATVYALLTGRPPFEAHSLPDLIVKIRNEEPEKPKLRQLSINDMFEGAVLKMLEKRPEDRYQTPDALLQDLERIGKFAGIAVD
ncbi:MAG: protein kinase [Planctomycetaceae bacterium]